jgi:hypothetical protein
MISIKCSKRKKCPAVKKLLGDVKRKTVGHCEFFFNLVNGNETFSTPDGKIHQSGYFQIQADSEEERSHRLKCLKKVYGEECTRVFEDIPGRNPIIDWQLSPEFLMRLSGCLSSLHNFDEQIQEMFDPDRKLNPFNRNSDMMEVWSRFIYYRFSLINSGLSAEDMNRNAVAWTEEAIEDLGSEENMSGLRYIAEQFKKNRGESEQAS